MDLRYSTAILEGFFTTEMLYRSSLLAIVGAGDQPSLSPRRLCLFDTVKGTALRELNFLTSILSVHVNRKRLIVLLQDQTYIYDVNNLEIKRIIDTVPNMKGLSAFCASLDNPYLALPSSTTDGSVLVYNVMDLQSHCESYSFRRGTYQSTIFSLSFGPSAELPDILLATSSSGSVHVFPLGFALNERSRKSNSFLGSIMPGSVCDAFDPSHHLVFHHAFPAGVKSDTVVRKIDKASGSSMSEFIALRATVSVITFNGYFQEYGLRVNHKNEAVWTMEHEFNLLTAVTEEN